MDKSFSNQFSLPGSNSKNYLILFLLWPFLAFLLALKNYSQRESRRVVYLYLIYYGLTFVIGNIYVDAGRYVLQLRHYAELPFTDFFKMVGGLYSSDTTVDIVEPLVSFIVSRFTSFYGVYFAVWAAIFGFFYLKSINILHDRYQESPGKNARVFLIFFVLIIPITTINGVRMYTASWIFFYGAYHVILYRDPKYLLLAFASSLVHFSFLSANVVLLIYFLAGNRNFIYIPIVFLSFILPQLFAPVFQSVSMQLGGAFQTRYEGYSNESYISEIQASYEQTSWFVLLSNDFVFYYLLFALIVIQIKSGKLMNEKAERNLFSFMLLFLSFVNFAKAIPSFGGRFQTIFYLFATVYVFLYFMKISENKFNLLTWFGLFPMLLYAAVAFRTGSVSISPWIFTPIFGSPLLDPGLSIADLLFH